MIVVVNIYIVKVDVQKMSWSMGHDMSHVLGFENEFMQIKIVFFFRNFRVVFP